MLLHESLVLLMRSRLGIVQKSGVKFEASIRKREKSNPRFGFLMPGHRYHDFYRYIKAVASPSLTFPHASTIGGSSLSSKALPVGA